MSLLLRVVLTGILMLIASGCSKTARDLALDPEVARASLDKAMKAWVEGKKPADLQPEIIVGDAAWNSGKKLVSYEIKPEAAMNDGTNLYLNVVCMFANPKSKKPLKSEVTYIVGTSPVVTIFPQ
jgi:hypothetical protein